MVPRIAIPVPTSTDIEYNRRSWPQYASAVQRSGGEAVRVELGSRAAVRTLLAECQGVLLPGSPADVLPARYGEEPHPLTAPADLLREQCDIQLLDDADRFGKPVLGVCFGVQSFTVWRGGSLVQHLTPLPVNHAAGSKVAIAHTVLVPTESLLASMVDRSEAAQEGEFLRLPVNTSHHQAVAAPGTGLRIAGRCPDDAVIEAVESTLTLDGSRSQFLLGVQWHPERSFDISATSRAFFARLVAEAVAWAETSAAVLAR